MKWMLKVETVISTFFFVLSWMVCAAWFGIKAGYLAAAADSEDKMKLFEKKTTK